MKLRPGKPGSKHPTIVLLNLREAKAVAPNPSVLEQNRFNQPKFSHFLPKLTYLLICLAVNRVSWSGLINTLVLISDSSGAHLYGDALGA